MRAAPAVACQLFPVFAPGVGGEGFPEVAGDQAPGQVVLKVSRSWIDDGGGIRTANERYIVAVPTWSASETTRAPAK